MELRLSNFRCYKEKTFTFPRGVILIDGPSGRGKTTILTAIKYALFGKVQQITTYGEKKTSVELIFNELHIVRTNVPSRLLVTIDHKTLEDDAAQEYLYTIFGRQFELTSYMVQKGSIQFFTLSGAEKLKLLEQLSLLGENNIQQMKDSIQRDMKDKKKQMEKLENQIELLESQLGEKPTLVKKKGLTTLTDIQDAIQFISKTKLDWEANRIENDQLLEQYTKQRKQQKQDQLARESLLSALRHEQAEINRLLLEKDKSMVEEDQITRMKTIITNHDEFVLYQQKEIELQNQTVMYNDLVNKEKTKTEHEIKKLQESLIPSTSSISELKNQITSLEEIRSCWKQLQELDLLLQKKEELSKQMNDLVVKDEEFSTYNEQLQLHEQFLSYQGKQNDMLEKKKLYQDIVTKEQDLLQKEIAELESTIQDEPLDITEQIEEHQRCSKQLTIWKRIREIERELANEKLKDIDTRFDTTKKNKDKIEKFIASMEIRKCVQKCPQCDTSLLVHSAKIVSAEHQPISDADRKTEEKYIADLPKWNKQFENQFKLIMARDEWLKEEEKLKSDVEGSNDTELEQRLQELTLSIDTSKEIRHTNKLLQTQLLEKQKQDPISKYNHLKKQWIQCETELQQLPMGKECENEPEVKEMISRMKRNKEKYQVVLERYNETTLLLQKNTLSDYIESYRLFTTTLSWDHEHDSFLQFAQRMNSTTVEESNEKLQTLQLQLEETIRIQQSNQMIEKQLKQLLSYQPEVTYKSMYENMNELQRQISGMSRGEECNDATPDENRSMLHDLLVKQKEFNRISSLLVVLQKNVEQKTQEANVPFDDTDYEKVMTEVMDRQSFVTEKYNSCLIMMEDYKQYYEQVKIYLSYRKKTEEIHEKKVICAIYYSQLEQLESLFQHMLQAEGICLEQFIRRVNQKMKWYLEHFFPDQSLQMEIKTEKECKSGKIKNEISVQLLQKQQSCDLKNLSGGEYDRCALAFMLTINELSHSPCLFLDESISSLDMSLSEEVLDVIKEKQSELHKFVLLISHQANTGFFDHVIQI